METARTRSFCDAELRLQKNVYRLPLTSVICLALKKRACKQTHKVVVVWGQVKHVGQCGGCQRHRRLSNPTVWHPCDQSSATWPLHLFLLKTIKKTFPLFTRARKSDSGFPAQPTTAVVPCVGCNFSNSIGTPSRLPNPPPTHVMDTGPLPVTPLLPLAPPTSK